MLVVDVDGGQLLHSYGDERDVIPRKLQKALVSSIKQDSSGNVFHSSTDICIHSGTLLCCEIEL